MTSPNGYTLLHPTSKHSKAHPKARDRVSIKVLLHGAHAFITHLQSVVPRLKIIVAVHEVRKPSIIRVHGDRQGQPLSTLVECCSRSTAARFPFRRAVKVMCA